MQRLILIGIVFFYPNVCVPAWMTESEAELRKSFQTSNMVAPPCGWRTQQHNDNCDCSAQKAGRSRTRRL